MSKAMSYIDNSNPEKSIKHLTEMEADDKVKLACSLMKSVQTVRPYTMAFSGGKDSCVMEYLAIEAGIQVPKVYNNTTIDPEGTISFCEKHGCQISRTDYTFLDLVELKGMPTMFRRFCCEKLKERYIADNIFVGIRRSESVKRELKYTCFEDTFLYTKKITANRFFPLLFFTDEDIAYVVNKHCIEMHPLYYDAFGHFCVERRLGCIGCPLQSDRGRMDFLRYPKLLKQILKRAIIYHRNHGRTKNDAYLNAVYNIFYSNHGFDKFNQAYKGLFDIDPKQTLEEYFLINLD